jgi:long-chain acyl-CoA synthetase
MVYGDRRSHFVALLVPDPEIASAPDLRLRLERAVDRVNADLSVIERIRRFAVAGEPFTIENEQLTPSMKIRRHVISKVYGERLDALYRS